MTEEPTLQSDTATSSRAPLAPIGGVVALAGFALLAVEVIRTLTGGVLGTIATVLLWVGVGLLAVGLLLLVLSLAGGDDAPAPVAPVAPEVPPAPVVPPPPVEPPAPVVPAAPADPPVAAAPPPPVVPPADEPAAAPAPAPPSAPESESESPSADGS